MVWVPLTLQSSRHKPLDGCTFLQTLGTVVGPDTRHLVPGSHCSQSWDSLGLFLGRNSSCNPSHGQIGHASAIPKTHPKESFQVPSPHTGPSTSRTWQDTAQQHIPHQDLDLYLSPSSGQCCHILPQPLHIHMEDQEFKTPPA